MIDWESLRAIVLDIEGTTCPVDFVTGRLFPYAREHLGALLSQADQQANLKPLLEEVQNAWQQETDARAPAYGDSQDPLALLPYLQWLIDQDLQRLSEAAQPHLTRAPHGLLIAGHGLYAWGEDLFSATRHLEIFEFLLEQRWRQLLLQGLGVQP